MLGKTKTVILDIQGMECNNCRAHVEKILLSVKGVKSVQISPEKKVIVTVKKSVDESVLKNAVINEGYKM